MVIQVYYRLYVKLNIPKISYYGLFFICYKYIGERNIPINHR